MTLTTDKKLETLQATIEEQQAQIAELAEALRLFSCSENNPAKKGLFILTAEWLENYENENDISKKLKMMKDVYLEAAKIRESLENTA